MKRSTRLRGVRSMAGRAGTNSPRRRCKGSRKICTKHLFVRQRLRAKDRPRDFAIHTAPSPQRPVKNPARSGPSIGRRRHPCKPTVGFALTGLGAAAGTQIGEPNLATLRHPGRARSRRIRHSPACFPCGPCATPARSLVLCRATAEFRRLAAAPTRAMS